MRTRHSPLKDQVAFLFDQTIRTRKIQTMSQPIIFVYLYYMESKDVKYTFSPNLSDAFADQRATRKAKAQYDRYVEFIQRAKETPAAS
jgi:hypothetical protein